MKKNLRSQRSLIKYIKDSLIRYAVELDTSKGIYDRIP